MRSDSSLATSARPPIRPKRLVDKTNASRAARAKQVTQARKNTLRCRVYDIVFLLITLQVCPPVGPLPRPDSKGLATLTLIDERLGKRLQPSAMKILVPFNSASWGGNKIIGFQRGKQLFCEIIIEVRVKTRRRSGFVDCIARVDCNQGSFYIMERKGAPLVLF